MDAIQKQLNNLDDRLSQIESSSNISRDFETAITERLGKGGELFKYIAKFGTATLASGTATINDGAIKATSIIIVTPQTGNAANDLSATCANGSATITSTGGADARIINYLIIF